MFENTEQQEDNFGFCDWTKEKVNEENLHLTGEIPVRYLKNEICERYNAKPWETLTIKVSEKVLKTNFKCCNYCGSHFPVEYMLINKHSYYPLICTQCFSDFFWKCNGCKEVVESSKMVLQENGDYFCEKCF